MKNKFEAKYLKMYDSNKRIIALYKNDKQINTFNTNDIDIKKIKDDKQIDELSLSDIFVDKLQYADEIKDLVLKCYKRGLKAEIKREIENKKILSSENLLSFMNEPLTEYDLKLFYDKYGLKGVKERCAEWNKKRGQNFDYSEMMIRVLGGN